MKSRIHPSRLIFLSFAGIIFSGMCLLMLPAAGNGGALTFLEALFTATSATCVTGLSVIDIGTRLTRFGQLVVLILIQIGGLGIITFSTFFIYLLSRRLSIRNREILLQSLSQHPVKDMGKLLLTVFQVTGVIEVLGALCLWLRLRQEFPDLQAFYYACFHSVSAFCNAGFSLFPDSLIRYCDDIVINMTIMALIVLGGIGFIVLFDIHRVWQGRRHNMPLKLSYHSQIVLFTSGVLIAVGAVVLGCCEWYNTLDHCSVQARILAPLFQAVTARTCGFNTLDIGRLTDASLVILTVLMFIGASPASTGGGIKTSTVAVLLAMVVANLRGHEDINLKNRRIPREIVFRAVSVAFCSAVVIGIATLVLVLCENGAAAHQQSHHAFIELLFEVVSAFGTVGLSTGITSSLHDFSKLILVLVMYIGRVGPLLLAIELAGGGGRLPYRLPEEENILIG
ncbi:MAG: TrkH family potassium uptake protein [Desulfobacterota bacterium]|nr:TrkH family potassium uptake protein [Thermodesulfobacteriota bacterium]